MARAERKIGIGLLGVGTALAGIALAGTAFAGTAFAASGASAGATGDACASAFTITWGADSGAHRIDVDGLVAGGSAVATDGTITVTLSNAEPISNHALNEFTIGGFDFATDQPVGSIQVRTWQAPGDYDYTTLQYTPPVNAGRIASAEGSHPTLGEAPIKGLELCYQASVAPTSTVASSTTIAPTSIAPTSVAPTSIAPTSVAPTSAVAAQVTSTVPVEVLAQVITAPQAETAARAQIAFTGSDTTPLVVVGGVFLLAGVALIALDRSAMLRRGGHSR